MTHSNSFPARLSPLPAVILWALLALPAHAGSDRSGLLNSLLERGLIAPEDYAAEMAKEAAAPSLALAMQGAEVPLHRDLAAARDTMVDYQWVVAMNEEHEKSPAAANHDVASHDHSGGHGQGAHNHFEGAYVVITEEWKRPSVRVDGEKIKVSESAPSLGIGYTFALSDKATLGLKATFDLKEGEFGKGETGAVVGETRVLEKSHYSLAVEPGYVVSQQTLVFGILAYHHARTGFEGGTEIKGISGVGYGVGFKRSLASHFFLMGEIQQVRYGQTMVDGIAVKPTSNTAALGIGYHF